MLPGAARRVAICGGAGWFKDFADPQSMLEPMFKGANITKDGGNNNLAQLNDPKIDAAMDKAPPLRATRASRRGRTSTR